MLPHPLCFQGTEIMMVLYSGTTCPFSQRCRLVLFEKGMDFEIRDVDLFNKPEDISTMNPYGQVPILVERELVLYESNIINEYIAERFPHQIAGVLELRRRGRESAGRATSYADVC
jgi:glutathione S-transferase